MDALQVCLRRGGLLPASQCDAVLGWYVRLLTCARERCSLQLLSLMLVALDIADEQDDYTAAKSIMVMSQTFYINTPEPSTGTESGATGPATHSRASSAASAGSDGASASAGTASSADGTRSSASGGESPAGADSNADDDNYAIGDDDDADSGFHGAGSVPIPTAESRRDASDPRTADLAPVSTAAEEAEEVRDPEYFQRHLKRHRVWQNMRFWESAVFEGIGSEMAKINTANQQELHMRETDVRHANVQHPSVPVLTLAVCAHRSRWANLRSTRST